jgi:hypothetical protein
MLNYMKSVRLVVVSPRFPEGTANPAEIDAMGKKILDAADRTNTFWDSQQSSAAATATPLSLCPSVSLTTADRHDFGCLSVALCVCRSAHNPRAGPHESPSDSRHEN